MSSRERMFLVTTRMSGTGRRSCNTETRSVSCSSIVPSCPVVPVVPVVPPMLQTFTLWTLLLNIDATIVLILNVLLGIHTTMSKTVVVYSDGGGVGVLARRRLVVVVVPCSRGCKVFSV